MGDIMKYCPFCGDKVKEFNNKYQLCSCEKAQRYHELSIKRKELIQNYFSTLQEIDNEINSLEILGLKEILIHASKYKIAQEENLIKKIERDYINPGFFAKMD